jgi:hypothetical protein
MSLDFFHGILSKHKHPFAHFIRNSLDKAIYTLRQRKTIIIESMNKNPLAEVFGFPISNRSREAKRYRRLRLCPFNNIVPSCTKDKASNPLGVCSILEANSPAIICPVRFREDWRIVEDAASFFFPKSTKWTSLTEVRLNDAKGDSAGNIDLVLVSYNKSGRITDFGAVEIQGVYITGNIRNPFEKYMESSNEKADFDWSEKPNYPKPDYLSSSRKRLAPQLLYKGSILKRWGKKLVVALNAGLYNTLPELQEIAPESADMAWLIYDLKYDSSNDKYRLAKSKVIYTAFESTLARITVAEAGDVGRFIAYLQEKLDDKMETKNAPDVSTLIIDE